MSRLLLRDPFLKLDRAEVHIELLHERIYSFLKDNPYRLEAKLDSDTSEVVVYFEPILEPPVEEWSVVIGDVVHNLRSSLDQLVWALTVDHQVAAPPSPIPRKGPGSEWRNIKFPILPDPHPTNKHGDLIPWNQTTEPNSLWGIRPSLRTDFQRLQPFNHGKDAPKKPLAILDELWNIDKHRHLPLTFYSFGLRDIVYTFPHPSIPEFSFNIVEKHPGGPLKGRTEIGRAEPIPQVEGLVLSEMHVQPLLSFDVAFEKGLPAYGGRVLKTLSDIRDEVLNILNLFDALSGVPIPQI